MIDGLRKLTQNISDRTDDLLALNLETYNLLHDFNVNGTGMIAADVDIKGCALDAMAIIDPDRVDGITMVPRFYDSTHINCGYGGANVYAGRIISSIYVSNPTSYKSFDLNTLALSSSFTMTADNRVCARKFASGALDFYGDYSETYISLKKVDANYANLTSVNTALTYSEFNYYSSKYKTRFLNSWVDTNPYIAWATRPDMYSPITVETRSYDLSTGAQLTATSYQLPYPLYRTNDLNGNNTGTVLDTYSGIYSKHGVYLVMMIMMYGKRFFGIIDTSNGKIYYIDTDIFFLFCSVNVDTVKYSWAQSVSPGYDGQYMPTIDQASAQIVDFMYTSGYFHIIMKVTTGLYYYLRFTY